MIRKLFTILLFALGILACKAVRDHLPDDAAPMLTHLQFAVLILSAAIALTPPFSRALAHWLDRFRHPAPRQRALFAISLGLASIAYLLFTAFRQHRELFPRFHDEHMYLLQMRLLSTFRLWTAAPHNPDFFDSFHILVKPVYASIYFPGTALLYAWELWLHAPTWLGPLLAAGAIIALTFRISAELLDDAVLGLLTALLILGVLWFRYLSMVIMSHGVVMLLGLSVMWAYLRWRKDPSAGWTILIGALAGWCAITRPIDAICYTLPVAVAMLIHLVKSDRAHLIKTVAIGIAAAVPLLSLQLILDKGVTGHFLKTPYQLYAEYYAPNLAYGTASYDPLAVPQTVVLQKKLYDEYFNKEAAVDQAKNSPVKSWFLWKSYQLSYYGLANTLLVILLPVGLLGLSQRPPRLLFAVIPIYIVGYAFFAFLMPHYCVVPSPALAFLAVLSIGVFRNAFPSASSTIDVFFTLAVASLAITSLSEFTHRPDDHLVTPTMRFVAEDLPRLVRAPAIVLFHYSDQDDYNQEPVYNLGTVNIDDAPIIRAHDLGPERNPELMAYYARTQPDRMVYFYDRHTGQLRQLGTAAELAEKYPLQKNR